jgi:hypothetical protein
MSRNLDESHLKRFQEDIMDVFAHGISLQGQGANRQNVKGRLRSGEGTNIWIITV